MKKIQQAIELKRKVFLHRFRMWIHRTEYKVHQNTEETIFWCFMAGLFVSQVLVYLGRNP